MSVLLDLVKKNFKVLIRSKSSALIIILGPLLVIFLVGIAFDNIGKYSLNIGTYSEEYSDLTESFISKLEDQEFRVQKVDSEDICVDMIKQGKLHTCIVFPPGLTVESDKMNEIVFHVDYSKINLIWMVLDSISTKLKERSSELSLDLTSDLLNKIESARLEIYNKKPAVINLKTENQEVSTKIQEFQSTSQDFKTTTIEVGDYILQKIDGASDELDQIKAQIDKSNATDAQKSSLNTKLSSIDTYFYNINSKIKDPSGVNKADWEAMIESLESIDSQISQMKQKLASSGSKIDEIQSTLDQIYLSFESIQVTNATNIVKPITTNIKPVVPQKSYLNYLFPSLIVLVIMFISVLLSTTIVMMEKHSPAYFRNFITPTRSITFIMAIYLTNMILVLSQIIIIFLISLFFFKSQIIPSLPVVIPGLLLITTFFTFAGMLVGYLFNSEETATLASISTGSVFLFMSNVILPLESMPEYVRNIAQFNPFVLGESILRKSIIFKANLGDLTLELGLLWIYSLVLFIVIWISQKAVRVHYFHRSHKKKTKAKK